MGEIGCTPLCDVNGDNKCNTTDARVVQQLAVGKVKASQLFCRFRPNPG